MVVRNSRVSKPETTISGRFSSGEPIRTTDLRVLTLNAESAELDYEGNITVLLNEMNFRSYLVRARAVRQLATPPPIMINW